MSWKKGGNAVDVVIDIETVASPVTAQEIEQFMAEYEPPSNYKTAEAILRHREKAERGAVEKLADQKRFSLEGKRMISCALGLARIESEDVVDIESWASDDLSVITKGIVEYLNNFTEYRLIGFNHKRFDLPEVAKSFALTKVKPRSRPSKWDIIDLADHPFQKTKLKVAAKAFGIEAIGNTGAQVDEMYQNGDWDAIQKYNEDDVRITGLLYIAASAIFTF